MTEPGARIHYEFGVFHLDIQQRLLTSGADRRPVPLPPKIFDTLLYLVERRGELLDKSTLMKAVWPNVVVEENSLNQNISVLRRTLGEGPGEHRFIVTEPGRGYRFVADVRVIAATPAAHEVQNSAARSEALRKSVAVLPFANLTGDPGKEYFGDGLAEELIHKLARLPGLRVPSRTSSFAYKGRNVDIRQIARDLDAGVVLEGSVRSAGERLRVTAQLIDGQDGYHLWSHSYDRKFEDLFELQDEIAQAIVSALRLTLDGSTKMGPKRPTENLEAYHLYLQATARYIAIEPATFIEAYGMYQRAIALDPDFARAYHQSAALRAIATVINIKLPGSSQDIEREVSRALELDPALGAAHAAVGVVKALQGQWLDAEDRFQRAFAQDDSDPDTQQSYSLLVAGTVGFMRRHHEVALAVHRLAPAWTPTVVMIAVAASLLGFDDEARAHQLLARNLGVSFRLGPMSDVLANCEARAGHFDAAADAAIEGFMPGVLAHGAAEVVRLVYRALGDPGQRTIALRRLDELREGMKSPAVEQMMNRRMLLWYVLLGSLDSAFALQDEAQEAFASQGTVGSTWAFLWMPEMRPFRMDPRFQGVVDRLRLMPYWERFGPPDGHELRGGRLVCS